MLLYSLVCSFAWLWIAVVRSSSIKGYDDFAWDFYSNYSNIEDFQNTAISPFAIYTSLMYTSMGAQMKSRMEIMRSFGTNRQDIGRLYSDFQNKRYNHGLKYAVGLFLDTSIKLKEAYVYNMYNTFKLKNDRIDFSKKSATKKINEWINSKAKGVGDVMDSNYISGSTRLLSMATVAMPTRFMYAFESTEPNVTFYVSPEDPRNVTMMKHKQIYLKTTSINGAPLVEIPFNSKIALFVLMPCINIDQFERKYLSAEKLKKYVNSMVLTDVSLELPMFNISSKIVVNEILMAMGIRNIFSEYKANFNNMLQPNQGSLHMSAMIQNINFKVTQHGEYGSSVSSNRKKSNMQYTKSHLSFNRPFIYFVMDRDSSRILHFMGQFVKPDVVDQSHRYYGKGSGAWSTTLGGAATWWTVTIIACAIGSPFKY